MIWSFSDSRTFARCQRQWYFGEVVANANTTKVPLRREAYLFSKLQTVSAWRGQIVDSTIEAVLGPALNSGRLPSLGDCTDIRFAMIGLLFVTGHLDGRSDWSGLWSDFGADCPSDKFYLIAKPLHCGVYGKN